MPNDDLSKISKKEKEKEKRDTKDISGLAAEVSRENEKNTLLLSPKAQHTESQCLADAKPYLAYLADAQDKTKEEHFEEVARKPPLICANCGEDLTGHSSITKNGKIYCTQAGCGYSPRGEAQT